MIDPYMHTRGCHSVIEDYVTEEKVCSRAALLHFAYLQMLKNYKNIGVDVSAININKEVLYLVAKSYFYDIARYKILHSPEENLDNDNNLVGPIIQSAFIMKWIGKLKPIYFTEILDPMYINANENYALRAGFMIAKLSNEVIIYLNNDIELMNLYLYTMRYRAQNEGQWMLWIHSIISHLEDPYIQKI